MGLSSPAAGDQAVQPSARALAYGILQSAIVNGTIEPGARLSEKSIAQACGVSRTPVGEALQQLATDGLVLIRPQQRTMVSRISAKHVQEACFVGELAGRIAVAVARDIAVRSVQERLKGLLRQEQAMAERGSVSGFLSSDLQFSAELVGLSGLVSLRDVARSAHAHIGRILVLSSPDTGTMMDWRSDNLKLFDALQLSDAKRAGDALCSRSKRAVRLLPALMTRYPGYFEAEGSTGHRLQLGSLTVSLRPAEQLDA